MAASSPPPGVKVLVCPLHDHFATIRLGAPRPPMSTCPTCQLSKAEQAERPEPVNVARGRGDVPGVDREWCEDEAIQYMDERRAEWWQEIENPRRGRPLYRRVHLGFESGREKFVLHPIRSPETRRKYA
jgi:hypothetical protein